MTDAVIKVSSLGKQYRIGGASKPYKTIRESVTDLALSPFRKIKASLTKVDDSDTFWALKDVNFEVNRGEVVGIIGRNGAGKSTLLKILSRITEPTEGQVEIDGRVGSLLEVGTGFHPELTGRENIYLNGAILGMKRTEIARKFDEIVAFAETEKFLDTPVKFYSSGMYTRLAFAVAAHLEPEILIVDEVLAVGDAQFQKKCMGKMGEVAKHGRTVLFVSHNMGALVNLCPRAIWLSSGKLALDGKSSEVVGAYIRSGRQDSGEVTWPDPVTAPGTDKVKILAVRVTSKGETTGDVDISDDVEIQVDFFNARDDARLNASIHLLDSTGGCILASANWLGASASSDPFSGKTYRRGMYRSVCRLPGNFLNDGMYGINAFVLTDVTNIEVAVPEALTFRVHESGAMRKEYGAMWIGAIRPRLDWNTSVLNHNGTRVPEEALR
jgi:lipopolysaccharide transport system ATP-binding protein